MSWVRPHNVHEFVAAQQHYLDRGDMLILDPATVLEFTHPVTFTLRGGFPYANGLDANGARFCWKTDGSWDHTMLKYSTDGQENQYFTLKNLSINGDQTGGAQASPKELVRIEACSGAAIRGFQIDNFTGEGCQNGIWIEGEVFEGWVNSPRLSWCRNAGIVVRHGYDIPGVASNIFISKPNVTRCSANMGAAQGILADRCSSVIITDGNFISLDGPAIRGTNGIKCALNCEFENTGNVDGAAIVIEANDFWSQVLACRGSNTQGQMKYLLRYSGSEEKLDLDYCRMWNGEIVAP